MRCTWGEPNLNNFFFGRKKKKKRRTVIEDYLSLPPITLISFIFFSRDWRVLWANRKKRSFSSDYYWSVSPVLVRQNERRKEKKNPCRLNRETSSFLFVSSDSIICLSYGLRIKGIWYFCFIRGLAISFRHFKKCT
jgi:hypothetical protein